MRVDERLVNGWQGSVCSNEADVRACAVLQGLRTGCSDYAQVEMQECGGGWWGHGLGKKKIGQNVHHRWIDSAEVGWDERTDRIAEFVRVIVSIGDVPLCEELNRRRDTTRFDAGWRITGRACASRHRGGSANRCTEQHKA